MFSEKVQRIKQHHLIRAVTSPEFSEETIDFFLMFIWLYIILILNKDVTDKGQD